MISSRDKGRTTHLEALKNLQDRGWKPFYTFDLLMKAIGNVAKAKGMTEIAQKADLNRQNLYKALSGNGTPKFDTVVKVLQAFGLKLTLAPADETMAAA